ncbi:MAG: ABC transporter permease, partial [Lachnospiraceae bacterium]|nr:ABC transporter permease [Lachnospiraceae bacterium]
MEQIFDYIKIALKNIRDNKTRSFLTMLGIIIGISSVIMIMSIGNGVTGLVSRELNSVFAGQIYLYANQNDENFDPLRSFSLELIDEAKEKIDNIKVLSPERGVYGTATTRKGTFTTYITACGADYEYTKPEGFVDGRYFTSDEAAAGKNVCVLLADSAKNLYGTDKAAGQSFTMEIDGHEAEMTVVGVREMSDSALYKKMYVYDDVELEMPFQTYINITDYENEPCFNELMFMPESSDSQKETAENLVTFFKSKLGIEINIDAFSDYSDTIGSLLDYVTIFVSLVAAISLAVGGIGVMNIMLVSVTERTQEIGIRKALGARTKSIVMQFLAEAAAITLIGGLIGLIVGFAGGELVCFLAGRLV